MLKVNNRVDAFDNKKWYEARVIEVKENEVKVHYRNYKAKYD